MIRIRYWILWRQIRSAIASALEHTEISAHFTGELALNEAYIHTVRRDLGRIFPLLAASLIVVTALLLGSLRAALVLMPVGVSAVLASIGLVGWMQWDFAAINSFAPIVLLTISLSGCVHMAVSFSHFSLLRRKRGKCCNSRCSPQPGTDGPG